MPPNPFGSLAVPCCDVCVVVAGLALEPATLATLEGLLSADERERAARLVAPARRRFVAGRGQLRRLLGRVVEDDPAALHFVCSPRGKPALAGRHADRCQFNVTHSRDICLVAVSTHLPVGIDFECHSADHTPVWADMMSGAILSVEELAAYRLLPPESRPEALLESWVAKEAILKGMAEGVAAGVRHLVLPSPLPRGRFMGDAPTQAVSLATVVTGAPRPWGTCLVDTDAHGLAALACPAESCRVAVASVDGLVGPESAGRG